jgi:hypothetical protein
MNMLNLIKYKALSILAALKLYAFPVVGVERINKTLSTLTDIIQELRFGESEARDEADEVRETIRLLAVKEGDLLLAAERAETASRNLKKLLGEGE